MNENRHAAGTKQAGISMGGKFAGLEKTTASGAGLLDPAETEQLPTLSQDQIEAIEDGEYPDGVDEVFRAHVQKLPAWERELVFIDQGDQLRSEQIDTYLAGDPSYELGDQLDETFDEQRYSQSEKVAGEILERLGVDDPQVNNDDLVRELAATVREYDTSDPVAELAARTHPQLMRAPLSNETFGESHERESWLKTNPHRFTRDELYSGHAARAVDARVAYVTDYLRRAGIDIESLTDHDRESIRDLVTEGPYYWHEGVRLDAIWYGRIGDASAPSDGSSRTFTLGGAPEASRQNPEGRTSLVLLDTVNGSGFEANFDSPFSITVNSDRPAMLDSGGSAHGYGWDDTAGVVKSAYAVGVQQAEPAEADAEK